MTVFKLLYRIFLVLLLFFGLGWAALTILLPLYLQKELLPELAAKAGIEQYRIKSLLIGPTRVESGFTLGREEDPVLTVSSLSARFSPARLLRGEIEEIALQGVEFRCTVNDSTIELADPSLQKLLDSLQGGGRDDRGEDSPDLPLRVHRFSIDQARFSCRVNGRDYQLPFNATVELPPAWTADEQIDYTLHLLPRDQSLLLTGGISADLGKGMVRFTAANLQPIRFVDLWEDRGLLTGESSIALTGSVDFTLTPFRCTGLEGELILADPRLTLTPAGPASHDNDDVSHRLTVSFQGEEEPEHHDFVFSASSEAKKLHVTLGGASLGLPDLSLKLQGRAAAAGLSFESRLETGLDLSRDLLHAAANRMILENTVSLTKGEAVEIRGNVRLDDTTLHHSASGLSLEDGDLVLPFSWPPSPREVKGRLDIGSIVWQEKNLGTLAGPVTLTGKRFRLDGLFRSELLDNLSATAELAGELAEAGRRDITMAVHLPSHRFTEATVKKILPDFKKIQLEAMVEADAEISYDENGLHGLARLDVQKGTVFLPEQKITVSGISTTLTLPDLPRLGSDSAQVLDFASIRLKDLHFTDGRVVYTLESPDALFVEQARVDWADGVVDTYALRFAQGRLQPEIILYCSKVKLASVMKQFGIANVSGDGTLTGRIPLHYEGGKITFSDSFLHSTPGEGGEIRLGEGDILTRAIPAGTPQFNQLDFAQAALDNFHYNWARLSLVSEEDTLVARLSLDGKPASPLPFAYDARSGGLKRTDDENAPGISQPIRLDVNFRLPLNTLLEYDKGIKKLLESVQ